VTFAVSVHWVVVLHAGLIYKHLMSEWISLASGAFGALIGSGTTIVTLIVKERYEHRRGLRQLALEMAKSDYAGQVQVFKDRPNHVTPLPVLVNYYQQLTRLSDNGHLDDTQFKRLAEERHRLTQADIY
jgi:hypothetical protein